MLYHSHGVFSTTLVSEKRSSEFYLSPLGVIDRRRWLTQKMYQLHATNVDVLVQLSTSLVSAKSESPN